MKLAEINGLTEEKKITFIQNKILCLTTKKAVFFLQNHHVFVKNSQIRLTFWRINVY